MRMDMCNTCEYYRQHYVLDDHHIFQVHCGHCTFSRVKGKKPDSRSCENYKPSDFDETAFATKEYLSKALLEYVLSLDLLPEIHTIKQEKEELLSKKHPRQKP